MSKEIEIVKIDAVCVKCQTPFSFNVDMSGKTEIRVVCPKCGYRNETEEFAMELMRDEDPFEDLPDLV